MQKRTSIFDSAKCSQKAVREDDIEWAFTAMWNKLVSNHTEILMPLLDTLKKLRIDEQQEQEIGECSNPIMELTEQGHILSRLVSKGYIDHAVFIERQNALTLELIRNNPHVIEEYRKDLFLQSIDKVIVQQNGQITFGLVNRLELSEAFRKEAAEAYANRI